MQAGSTPHASAMSNQHSNGISQHDQTFAEVSEYYSKVLSTSKDLKTGKHAFLVATAVEHMLCSMFPVAFLVSFATRLIAMPS